MNGFRGGFAAILFFSLTSTACAQVGKVTIRVTDFETGKPLPGVRVFAGFATFDGIYSGPANHYECDTDLDGECSIWGHGNGGSVAVGAFSTDKYYGISEGVPFKGSLGPVASPWNPTIELRLKEKRNPIPMYAKNLSQKRFPEALFPRGYDHKKGWLEMPADSGTVAYDLEKGDWVEPYGKGSTDDLVFHIRREARVQYIDDAEGFEYQTFASGATVDIMVTNDGDGFIPYLVAEEERDKYPRLPYEAPSEGYESIVRKHFIDPPNKIGTANIEKNMNYFLRVRTVKDVNGKIISAHYGKIYGDFLINSFGNDISFAYYLNPTPNDRNVEFKMKSSLIPDLSSSEQKLRP